MQTFVNGKLVLIDFKKLNYRDFTSFANNQETLNSQLVLIGIDGKAYINDSAEYKDIANVVLEIFEGVMTTPINELQIYKKELRKVIKGVSENPEDILRMDPSDNRKIPALYNFFLGVELQRREIEKRYYNPSKFKAFSPFKKHKNVV